MPSKKSNIGKETIINFIQNSIKNNANFEDILEDITFKPPTDQEAIDEKIIDRSTRGFYYERLWDLCIKFGLTDLTLKPSNDDFTTHFDDNANNDIVTIENCDLKTYFEMLLILFLEGLYKFCRYSINNNNKFDLNVIKPDDITKINSYFRKIQIKLNFKIFDNAEWQQHINNYKTYDKIEINSETKLEDLYSIFYVFPNVYLVNFTNVKL